MMYAKANKTFPLIKLHVHVAKIILYSPDTRSTSIADLEEARSWNVISSKDNHIIPKHSPI